MLADNIGRFLSILCHRLYTAVLTVTGRIAAATYWITLAHTGCARYLTVVWDASEIATSPGDPGPHLVHAQIYF